MFLQDAERLLLFNIKEAHSDPQTSAFEVTVCILKGALIKVFQGLGTCGVVFVAACGFFFGGKQKTRMSLMCCHGDILGKG